MPTGWVSTPNERGTLDIICGTFSTIVLCTWTAICLNIPHPDDSILGVLKRKAKWMFWAIVAPELVLSVAIGQYASARRSVQRFHKLGHSSWTMRHAFFADMGGVMLQPKHGAPFVVNGRQLAYLVQHQYVAFPKITASEIWDRSKADSLGRLITLFQASWLLFNLVGRAISNLAISSLELLTGAIVFCSFGIFVCWFQKPSDVRYGVLLATDKTINEILIQAGDAAGAPYKHTPLDFVARESFTCGYDVLGFFGMRADHRERPLRCFPNDRFPDIRTFEKFVLFCMTTIYSGLHLLGWQFEFPSRTEKILWRMSSLIITGTTVLFWVFETIAARHRFGRWDKYLIMLRFKQPPLTEAIHNSDDGHPTDRSKTETKTTVTVNHSVVVRHDTLQMRDAFEVEQKKQKPIPTWEALLLLPIVLIYVVARSYQMVEALVSLRDLPLGVYDTFNIAESMPHW